MTRVEPSPRRRTRTLGLRSIVQRACLLALLAALLWVPASIAAAPADTLATETYLQAGYELYHATYLNVAASSAAAVQVTSAIGRECRGVLADAPKREVALGPLTPRARGELQRVELQLGTIQDELARTINEAVYQPDEAAIEAYVAQVTPLSWSNPPIAAIVHVDALILQEDLAPAPAVCADMRAWAQSGYRTLSPASVAFEAAQKGRPKAPDAAPVKTLLEPYENVGERMLLQRTDTLQSKTATAFKGIEGLYLSLQRALGLRGNATREPQGKILGQGRTATGASFVVRRDSAGDAGSSCHSAVSITIDLTRHDSTEQPLCISRGAHEQPASECSLGTRSIIAALPASVITVRLRLKGGRTLTSKAIRIALREGGPGGIYVQSLRPGTPPPVSLTELDREGKLVRTIKLTYSQCKTAKQESREEPTLVKLAPGSTPGGEPFRIEALLEPGTHTFSNLSLETSVEGQTDTSMTEAGIGRTERRAFSGSLATGCPPQPFSIIYGTLAAPGTAVLVLTSTGLVPLTEVQVASDLHADGPLFYGVFATPPSEVVVQGSGGETLYTESLTAEAQQGKEYCEGFEEG